MDRFVKHTILAILFLVLMVLIVKQDIIYYETHTYVDKSPKSVCESTCERLSFQQF